MKNIEEKIETLLLSANLGVWPEGQIKCDMTNVSAGYTGSITSGLIKKTKIDFIEILDSLDLDPEVDFSSLLFKLREASKSEQKGPIYLCNIIVKGKKLTFKYFWEGESFSSLDEIEPDLHGSLPSFIYERMFTTELIEHIKNWELDTAIFMFVPAQKQRKEEIPAPLLDMYALIDWQSDTDNGGLNQYFARDIDYFGCFDREELYPRVLKAIRNIGHKKSEKLYQEAIALYSNFYGRIEHARVNMNIEAVPKEEESDINDRYFQIYEELESVRHSYIKDNSKIYAVNS